MKAELNFQVLRIFGRTRESMREMRVIKCRPKTKWKCFYIVSRRLGCACQVVYLRGRIHSKRCNPRNSIFGIFISWRLWIKRQILCQFEWDDDSIDGFSTVSMIHDVYAVGL